MQIKAPFLTLEMVREAADAFLRDYHVTGDMPVPIDWIAEKGLEMDIVPVPGLRRGFDNDASISSDLSTIYVDEDVYLRVGRRYRYSVAHEIGHRILHRDVFRQMSFGNLREWKEAVQSIPEDQYSWIERQAYWFAGLVLVPAKHLRKAFEHYEDSAAAAGLSLRDADDITVVCDGIGRKIFDVSKDVVKRRLKEDKLWIPAD